MQTTDDRNNDALQAVRSLISRSEELLAAIGEEGSQRYHDATIALERQIRHARDQVDDLHYSTARRARLAARRADLYVHENPWRTAGAAAAIGAAVGALVALLIVRLGDSDSGGAR
jgi:ElaB/YqjD/DUF883 family membrane-anchored ribosome-binding protein